MSWAAIITLYREQIARLFGLLLVGLLSTSVHAQLFTCLENGKEVLRLGTCVQKEPQKPFAPGAKSLTTHMRIFSQVTVFRIPPDWKPVWRNATATDYIMEFIPEAQALAAWKDMITVQGFRDGAKRADIGPRQFLMRIASSMEKVCGPKVTVAQFLGDSKVDSFDAHSAIIGCANMQGRSEIAYFLAIKGSNDMYVLQRAFRGESFDRNKPPLSATNAAEFASVLQPVKICEVSDPQDQCVERKPR